MDATLADYFEEFDSDQRQATSTKAKEQDPRPEAST